MTLLSSLTREKPHLLGKRPDATDLHVAGIRNGTRRTAAPPALLTRVMRREPALAGCRRRGQLVPWQKGNHALGCQRNNPSAWSWATATRAVGIEGFPAEPDSGSEPCPRGDVPPRRDSASRSSQQCADLSLSPFAAKADCMVPNAAATANARVRLVDRAPHGERAGCCVALEARQPTLTHIGWRFDN